MTPDLVARAQNGDREAFEEIASSVVRRLYGTATLIIRDPDAASAADHEALDDEHALGISAAACRCLSIWACRIRHNKQHAPERLVQEMERA